MMKHTEIMNTIKSNDEALRIIEKQSTELSEKILNEWNLRRTLTAAEEEENNKIIAEMCWIDKKYRCLELTNAILTSNYKIQLVRDVLPVVLDVLSKYSGKSVGEKRRDAISDEVKAETGCRVTINNESITIYPVSVVPGIYPDSVTVGTTYVGSSRKSILIDNRVQSNIEYSDFQLWYDSNEYVEDVEKRVNSLVEALERAEEARKVYVDAAEVFNSLAVGKIHHIDYSSNYSTIKIEYDR